MYLPRNKIMPKDISFHIFRVGYHVSLVFHLWGVPYQHPAVVYQHAEPPPALLLLLHLSISRWKHSPCSSLTVSKFVGRKLRCDSRNNLLWHSSSHDFVGTEKFFNKWLIVLYLEVSEQNLWSLLKTLSKLLS